MTDDSTLLQRYAREHSEAAFAELVQRHINLVYSAAVRRCGGDTHRAKDVTQQVFVSLAQHAGSLERHPALSAWLYTATRNAATSLWISEQRRIRREEEAVMNGAFAPDAERIDWTEARQVIDAAMDELSDEDRKAVLLRFFEKRSFADVGAALGIPGNTARMRTFRALEKLRILLKRRGVSSTAAALGAAISQQAVTAAPRELAAAVACAVLGCAPGSIPASVGGRFLGLPRAGFLTLCALGGALSIWIMVQAFRSDGVSVVAQSPHATEDPAATASAGSASRSYSATTPQAADPRQGNRNGSLVPAENFAEQILQRMVAAYGALSSYRDSGSVVRTREGVSQRFPISFQTAFRRPDHFRMDWASLSDLGNPLSSSMIWWTDGQARSQWNGDAASIKIMSPSVAISVGMVTSCGAAYHVPRFYVEDGRSYRFSLAGLQQVKLAEEETIEGTACYHLKAQHPNGNPYELWIGKDDFLLRKLVTVTPLSLWTEALPKKSSNTTPQYTLTETHRDIQINTDLPDAIFQMKPQPSVPQGSSSGVTK